MTVVGVYLIGVPYVADKQYDYLLPPHLPRPEKGAIVTVPFGRGDHHRAAIVAACEDREEDRRLKAIFAVEDPRFSLSGEMFALAAFLREHTLCSFGDAARAILPPALFSGNAAAKIATVAEYRAADPNGIPALLEKRGREGLRSPAHRRILEHLLLHPAISAYEAAELGVNTAQLGAMVKNGHLLRSEREVLRSPYEAKAPILDPIALSRAQTAAYESLLELSRRGRPEAALLFGVTGSGKTKVMMKLMDEVIAEGRGVILMVPEIALTPQTVGIFCKRYGERVAVIHSALSQGERLDAWRRAERGEVDLVIGTRSAIFAPLDNIGMIVIDEEHEHTYKSESDPKYHARDIASYRCGRHRALMLLASATPALESFYKAKSGTYTLVPLRERYGGARLPKAVIVDMREELRLGNPSPISQRLYNMLTDVKENDNQAILFLNRRGYSSHISCKECGEVLECPRCSVSLTFHSHGGGAMLCHMCGYRMPTPRACPSCSAEALSFLGFGTQKLESEMSKYLPEMTVMRMDADTTQGKLAYDRMLDDFREGRADILLGTQMVAKGHDFPRVTLVGVALADTSLHVTDFRASERTFSLLTQVIGRAGRASDEGVAVIQTFQPSNGKHS